MRMIILSVALLIGATHARPEINFFRGSLAEAQDRAQAAKKPVMIDFITDWCRWCDTLDARTYADPEVARYVNRHLIPIKVDAEKGRGIEIARKYGVSAYPTIVLIQPDGLEIDRILGFVEPAPFLRRIRDYLGGINTLPGLLQEAAAQPDNPSLQHALAAKYLDRNDTKNAAHHFERLLRLDPSNSLGHKEEAEYTVALFRLKTDKKAAPLEEFIRNYPASERVRSASTTLWRSHLKANDTVQAHAAFSRYIETHTDDASMMNNYAWTCAEARLNLEEAAAAAERAVRLAPNDLDKASYLDTFAAVEFARGNVRKAIALEEQALEILKGIPNAKLKEFETALSKFRSAVER